MSKDTKWSRESIESSSSSSSCPSASAVVDIAAELIELLHTFERDWEDEQEKAHTVLSAVEQALRHGKALVATVEAAMGKLATNVKSELATILLSDLTASENEESSDQEDELED